MTRVLLVVCLGLALLLGVPVAHAFSTPVGAQIIVTTTADVLADDGFCSLREAIQSANLDAPSGTLAGECVAGIGDDIIVLEAETYEIAIEGVNEDQNLTGDFDIRSPLKIIGQSITAISGNSLDRVVQVHSGTVTLYWLYITKGLAPAGASEQIGAHGGGIHNAGNLLLDYVTVSENQAGRGGDGLSGQPGGSGGGIYTSGALTITNSHIYANRAGTGGTAANGHPNYGGEGGHGGGIFVDQSAQVTIQQSRIDQNIAGKGTDAPSCNLPSVCTGPLRGGNGGSGGGIAIAGTASIINTVIHDNRAGQGGHHSDTWTSSGGYGGNGGGVHVTHNGIAVTQYSTINRNYAGRALGRFASPGVGGGISGNMTVTTSIIAQNMAYSSTTPLPSDCAGHFEFFGRSLTGTTGCPANPAPNLVLEGYDPQLDMNSEILPGSAAIDAGICPDTAIDYLGDPRRIDNPFMPDFADACDIGADELSFPLVEVGPVPLLLAEGQEAETLAVRLAQPTEAIVVIDFRSTQAYVHPPELYFTPETWNTTQYVGVLAIDDNEVEFNHIGYVDMFLYAPYPRNGNFMLGDVAVRIRDNDAAMIYLPMVRGQD